MSRYLVPALFTLALVGLPGCGKPENQKSQQELTEAQEQTQAQADQDEKAMQKEQRLKNKKK
jgi:flagellar basal body L-ring protein FlgH